MRQDLSFFQCCHHGLEMVLIIEAGIPHNFQQPKQEIMVLLNIKVPVFQKRLITDFVQLIKIFHMKKFLIFP